MYSEASNSGSILFALRLYHSRLVSAVFDGDVTDTKTMLGGEYWWCLEANLIESNPVT